jgi:dienelactone hydrolase
MSLADKKPIGVMRMGEDKLRAIAWADHDHLLVITSATALPFGFIGHENEWAMLQVWDVGKNKLAAFPDGSAFPEMQILNTIGRYTVRHIDGHAVLFVVGFVVKRGPLGTGLIRIELDASRERLLRQGDNNSRWVVDEDGELVAETDYYGSDQRWVLKIGHGHGLHEITEKHAPIDVPSILGLGPTPGTLLMSTFEQGEPQWRLVSLADGTVGEPMAERAKFDRPLEAHGRMIGGVRVEDAEQDVFFDPAIQKHWSAIVRAFPDEHVRFVSASDDFQKVVVLVEGERDGYAYHIVDLGTHRAEPVGDVYSGLTTVLMKKRLTYKAADGLDIPAYLTLPKGREPKNLPLVVFVHGGPALRDTAELDWWSQAYALEGYAVLQPNYRGSDLTRSFMEAGYGQWGRRMQTDLSDGVRYLVKEGIADPARVCIVGGSYGGYAALAGATLDPGVYRCAVSVAGVSDIRRLLEWMVEYVRPDSPSVRYWDRFMGVTGPRDPMVDTFSPIKHVDAVNIPVLLVHGKDDTVVPYEQSTAMNDALKRAGKSVELVTLKREDHWLSRSETRRQMLEASVRFLHEHNPTDGTPAPPAAALHPVQ